MTDTAQAVATVATAVIVTTITTILAPILTSRGEKHQRELVLQDLKLEEELRRAGRNASANEVLDMVDDRIDAWSFHHAARPLALLKNSVLLTTGVFSNAAGILILAPSIENDRSLVSGICITSLSIAYTVVATVLLVQNVRILRKGEDRRGERRRDEVAQREATETERVDRAVVIKTFANPVVKVESASTKASTSDGA